MTLVNYSPSHRRAAQAKATGAVRRESQLKMLLTGILVICIWRSTGMSYGYPPLFEVSAGDNVVFMKALLYSLVPLTALYAMLDPTRVLTLLSRTPIVVTLLALVCVASILQSINMAASVRGLIAVVIMTLAVTLYRTRYGAVETWRVVYLFFVVAAFANIAYTIVFPKFAVMGGSYHGMVRGLFYHKNIMAQFFAIGFFVIALNPTVKYNFTMAGLVKALATVCILVLLVLARSSTAMIMIGVGGAIAVGLNLTRALTSKPARIGIIVGGSATVGGAVAISYTLIVASLASAFGKDATLSGRSGIWEQLLPLVYDRPLLGYGFAVFRQPESFDQFVRASWNVSSTHNTYLELCLNIGVPGTCLLLIIILSRLLSKLAPSPATSDVRRLQALEVIVIMLVMVGAGLEAGMLLAPLPLWPLLVMALPASFDAKPRTSARAVPVRR
ncbi:hypothetical protein AS593_15490 [Caulobacter vibrioides]|nr:hypothetical protein AS593_15490 [Caulobacter vibrioides]